MMETPYDGPDISQLKAFVLGIDHAHVSISILVLANARIDAIIPAVSEA